MNAFETGITVGVLVGVLVLLVWFVIEKKKTYRYDERQQIGQGKAYKAGFVALVVADLMVTLLLEVSNLLPGDPFIWHMLAIMIGIGTFALTAIHFDAYLSMNQTPKQFIGIGCFFVVSMLCCAVTNFRRGEEDNFSLGCLNLMAGAIWLMIVMALLLHNRKKAGDEE